MSVSGTGSVLLVVKGMVVCTLYFPDLPAFEAMMTGPWTQGSGRGPSLMRCAQVKFRFSVRQAANNRPIATRAERLTFPELWDSRAIDG